MEERVIFSNILNDYIESKDIMDQRILRIFVKDGIHDMRKIASLTGETVTKVSQVIRGLQVHLWKAGYC